jgi:hypothetical protein
MKNLDQILSSALQDLQHIPPEKWTHKPLPEKWSKKEILGHLVDSARNNLTRFIEVQYTPGTYKVIPYQQDHQVTANGFQQEPLEQIRALWLALNHHIWYIMGRQTPETLGSPVELPNGTLSDLQWLMEDYIDHLQHHLKQILDTP